MTMMKMLPLLKKFHKAPEQEKAVKMLLSRIVKSYKAQLLNRSAEVAKVSLHNIMGGDDDDDDYGFGGPRRRFKKETAQACSAGSTAGKGY